MSAGEKSCSLLSKTVVRPSISLTEGIQILGPVLPPPTLMQRLILISFMRASCHVGAVCLCNSIFHHTVQRRGIKKSFVCAGEKSLGEDYTRR